MKIRYTIPLIGLLMTLSACLKYKELVNFNEGPDFSAMQQEMAAAQEIKLQPGDLVVISIFSTDPVAAAPFNLSASGSSATGAGMGQTSGSNNSGTEYMLDGLGNIVLPMIGTVQAAGVGTAALRDTITQKLRKYIIDPIVNVRLNSFRFTVLGEVGNPGTYPVSGERISILEALGVAGDINTYGNREKVLIIREINGKRSYGTLNLHQRDMFNSPWFYLQPRDVVYVEPLKAKIGATTDQGTKALQWAFPVITVISLLISLFR